MADITVALSWMLEKARDNLVGYSMDFRQGQKVGYTEASAMSGYANNYAQDWNGRDKSEIHTYYDCSSSIYYALKEAGYDVNKVYGSTPWATGSMDSCLLALGFTHVTGTKLIAGDIGVYDNGNTGHTWMITSECTKSSMNVVHAKGRNSTGTAVVFEDQFLEESGNTHQANYFYRAADSTGQEVNPETKDISIMNVAAMAGNFYWEAAGINPAVWEFSATSRTWTALNEGYGLAQWTNTENDTHGRLYQLYQWMNDHNYAMYSGDGQVEYIFEEKVWHTYNSWQSRWGVNSFEEFLNLDWDSLDDLTECWMDCFEGIQDSSLSTRQARAKTYYDYITEHKDDSSITKWKYDENATGPLSDDDAANNAVMLYRAIYNLYNEYGYSSDGSDKSNNSGNTGDGGMADSSNEFVTALEDLINALYGLLGTNATNDLLIHIMKQREN